MKAGARVAGQFQRAGARRVLVCGQYAWLNAGVLAELTDGVVVDEPEGMTGPLLAFARGNSPRARWPASSPAREPAPSPSAASRDWQLPAGTCFPRLPATPSTAPSSGLAGNIQATRGCHHRCSYCAVYAAYGVAAIPVDTDMVLADAAQLAAARRPPLRLRRRGVLQHPPGSAQLHGGRRGPAGPGDVRADHPVRPHPGVRGRRAQPDDRAGPERSSPRRWSSPSEKVLQVFDKGIDVPGIKKAIRAAKAAGVELRPTFITFTPWVTLAEIQALEDFLDETGIAGWVDHTAKANPAAAVQGLPAAQLPMAGRHHTDRPRLSLRLGPPRPGRG